MISLQGDKRLIAKLSRLKRKDFSKATRAGQKIIQAGVREVVPVRTGMLKSAIKVRAMKRRKGQVGTLTIISFPGGGKYYGSFVELGTRHIRNNLHWMKKKTEELAPQAMDRTLKTVKEAIDATVR